MKGLIEIPGMKTHDKKVSTSDAKLAQFLIELAVSEDVSIEELLLNMQRG